VKMEEVGIGTFVLVVLCVVFLVSLGLFVVCVCSLVDRVAGP
jgi:hypothetical protein